ncbi:MAG: AMP-binding enzyme [Zhaonellaceae bacterium]
MYKMSWCVGINDDIFGQRLKAYVQLKDNKSLTADELLEWLGSRVARFQLPKEIVFVDSIPYTPLGKHDKKHI